MINRAHPNFKTARRYFIDAYERGTTIHIDWSFPKGSNVGKDKVEKAVRRAVWDVQRQTRQEFKVWAVGESKKEQGFHSHAELVITGKLDEDQELEMVKALRDAWFFMINGKRKVSDKRRKVLEQKYWDCNIVRGDRQYLLDNTSKGNMSFDDHDVLTNRWKYVLYDHPVWLKGFEGGKEISRKRRKKSQ
jgi:hypothetical protein